MNYNVVTTKQFNKKMSKFKNEKIPRIDEIFIALKFTLSKNPFQVGKPIPKEPDWPYGYYRVLRTIKIGQFLPFDVVYRITDDNVVLIDIQGPIL